MKDEAQQQKIIMKAKLDQLLVLAKDKNGVLEQKDITDTFAELDLEANKIEQGT